MFQLNYAAMVDKLIQQGKLNHCHGLTLGSNPKMWNRNLHYKLLEKGAGKYEGSEESEVSSQGTESSQQETDLAHLTQRIDQ